MELQPNITKLVNILVKSEDIHGLIISAKAGLGKTTTVINTLQQMGLVEDTHFIYVSGHITPLKFFNLLAKTRILDIPKLIIIDDVDQLISNKTSLELMKSGLSEARGKRIVVYESRGVDTDKLNFQGKMIILTNNLSKNKYVAPLLDRCLVYDFESNPKDLYEYVEKNLDDFGKGLSESQKVSTLEKLYRFIDHPTFSLRMIERAFAMAKSDEEDWYSLFLKTIREK